MKNFFLNIFEDWIRNISGGLGTRLRSFYYKRRLAKFGKHVTIDTGVFLVNPGSIIIHDNVWIDKNSILIAGKVAHGQNTIVKQSSAVVTEGVIEVGSHSHIGIGTIIQGHGGVSIGNYFTSSASCRIYSLSNDYRKCRKGTMDSHEGNEVHYILSPVQIGENVWLGLNVNVIGAQIESDVFVMPNSTVSGSIGSNTVASGNPAAPVKRRFNDI